jgi:hypothetical protein
MDENCEACSVSVWLSPEEIENLFGTFKVKKVKTVSEEKYRSRLSFCLACESLLYGTTCRFCGCIVQIKNKLEAAKCPLPYAPKW